MYDWFKAGEVNIPNFTNIPSFTYAKAQIDRDIAKFFDYFRTAPRFVNNQHLVVKILTMLSTSHTRDNYSFINRVRSEYISLVNTLEISTATNFGKIHYNGNFYNKSVKEIIIAHETDFDIDLAYENWTTLEPIKILSHPFTDLSMQRCNGNYQSEETGYAVFAINVPMLALQFKAWSELNEKQKPRLRVGHFVSMYVLSNMLYTHFDLAYLNRIKNRLNAETVSNVGNKHPFTTTDYSGIVDSSIIELIDRFRKKKSVDWFECAFNTKLLTTENLTSHFNWLDIIPNRQIKWAVTIGYLNYWEYLALATGNNPSNRMFNNKLKLEFKAISNDRLLETVLRTDKALTEIIDNKIKAIEERLV